MSGDDGDRIDGRLDEDQQELIAAAEPFGFELRQPRKRPLEDLALAAFEPADAVTTRLRGTVDGTPADLFEYSWTFRGRRSVTGTRIVLVLRHPSIDGEAHCTREALPGVLGQAVVWFALGIVFLALFWLVLPIMWMQHRRGERVWTSDHRVGDREFDRRFNVDALNRDLAKRALPLALQQLVVAAEMKGPIDVRPGQIALAIDADRLDPETLSRAVRIGRSVLGIYAPKPDVPELAYRVAEPPPRLDEPVADEVDALRTTKR